MPLARLIALVAVILGLWPGPAAAHKLKIFAIADGPTIQGFVFFGGDRRARRARVEVFDEGGNRLAELVSGVDGGFRFEARHRGDHRIVADLGDGHRVETVVRAAELPASLPDRDVGTGHATLRVAAVPEASKAQAPASAEQLAALIDAAVARHVASLREQHALAEETVRWRDVLGGLGYILGLVGIGLYVANRRR